MRPDGIAATLPAMRVVMLVYPGVQVLDVTGPLEVFANANRRLDELGDRRAKRYEIEIAAREPGRLRSTCGESDPEPDERTSVRPVHSQVAES